MKSARGTPGVRCTTILRRMVRLHSFAYNLGRVLIMLLLYLKDGRITGATGAGAAGAAVPAAWQERVHARGSWLDLAALLTYDLRTP